MGKAGFCSADKSPRAVPVCAGLRERPGAVAVSGKRRVKAELGRGESDPAGPLRPVTAMGKVPRLLRGFTSKRTFYTEFSLYLEVIEWRKLIAGLEQLSE